MDKEGQKKDNINAIRNTHDAIRDTRYENQARAKVLIVDDDAAVLSQLKWALDGEYNVLTASNKEAALEIVRKVKPELIALDINLSDASLDSKEGIEILEEIKSISHSSKVIMVTGNDSKELALEAINKGANDYYLKPVNVDELKIIFKRAIYIRNLENDNKQLSKELEEKFKFENMAGSSPQMEEVFRLIRRVAPSEATVLISGESGTGKELVARAVHYLSARKNSPFVVINCGAIPENLLESELFGHEKGAFTDAHTKRIGKLEVADKGTVFLDEIGEMSLNLQVKILRFLQERVIERVGGNAPIELDVRIIAATNSNLQRKIEEGLFREDLYYRLSVINIELPPLRERGEDILLLAHSFLNKYRAEVRGKDIRGFSKEAKELMRNYSWPGNVRELENKVRRALILAEAPFIAPEELGFKKEDKIDVNLGKLSLKEARQHIEIKLIKRALEENKGSISGAAKVLDITRPTLYDLMKKYKIDK